MRDDLPRDLSSQSEATSVVPARRQLSPQAERALREAEQRRVEANKAAAASQGPKELEGPKGPEPTRFGDWERKGIASDF
jgi:hypothetical protein